MFKISPKIILMFAILSMQNPVAHGAGGLNFDFRPLLALCTVGGIGAGVAGTLAVKKAYSWARYEQGTKKIAGRTFLGATGIGTLVGIGYLMGCVSKKC